MSDTTWSFMPRTNGFPSNFPSWKKIYGPYDTRIANMKTAFSNIMQAGVQVSLLQ